MRFLISSTSGFWNFLSTFSARKKSRTEQNVSNFKEFFQIYTIFYGLFKDICRKFTNFEGFSGKTSSGKYKKLNLYCNVVDLNSIRNG